mmetsp:Transcript_13520/g.36484  ORF Transcript_13520/g.36484 Transcript_13520/m.36484 type:complete len:211 (-) Transcript_13520:915-1547(-)
MISLFTHAGPRTEKTKVFPISLRPATRKKNFGGEELLFCSGQKSRTALPNDTVPRHGPSTRALDTGPHQRTSSSVNDLSVDGKGVLHHGEGAQTDLAPIQHRLSRLVSYFDEAVYQRAKDGDRLSCFPQRGCQCVLGNKAASLFPTLGRPLVHFFVRSVDIYERDAVLRVLHADIRKDIGKPPVVAQAPIDPRMLAAAQSGLLGQFLDEA